MRVSVLTIGLGLACAAAWQLEARLALLGLFIAAVLYRSQAGFIISPRMQVGALTIVFALSLLAFPYWHAWRAGAPRTIGAGVLLLCGAGWPILFRSHATAWEAATPRRAVPLFAAVFAAGLLLFHTALADGLAYHGDSDYHTTVTITLVEYFAHWRPLLLAACGLAGLAWFARRRSYVALFIGLAAMMAVGVVSVTDGTAPVMWYQRYPTLFYYLNAAFSIPLYAWHNRDHAYVEGFYRLLAFVSVVGLAVIGAMHSRAQAWYAQALVALAILTLPTLGFYASLTYIELPMMVLMFAALLGFDRDLAAFVRDGSLGPAFVGVMLIGFLKETTPVVLAAFGGVAAWAVLFSQPLAVTSRIRRIAVLGVLLGLPVALYLAFKPPFRSYEPRLSNLLAPGHYEILARSWWEQFGLLAVLAPLAWLMVWRRGARRWCVLTAVIGIGYVLFFAADRAIVDGWHFTGNELLGYSRFNLYLLPPILAVCVRAASLMKGRYLVPGCAGLVVAVNAALTPVSPWTAERGVFWGDYTSITADLHTPYDQVYAWLRSEPAYRRILVLGRSYTYQDPFYFTKYRISMARFDATTTPAEARAAMHHLDDYDLVLYHEERFAPAVVLEAVTGWSPLRTFDSEAVRIVAYARPGGPVRAMTAMPSGDMTQPRQDEPVAEVFSRSRIRK